MTSPIVSLSVIVVVLGGPNNLERCLAALMQQTGVPNAEFIVSYDDVRDISSELAKQFREVKFMHASGHRTFAALRALGIHQAHGELIAITEDHCTPRTDWCAQIIQAHTQPHAAIGGAVESSARTALSWAVYLCDYSRYMNPLCDGPSNQLTDCNVSYKRQALAAICGVWSVEFHEPMVHAALLARGDSLYWSSKIVVYQDRAVTFSQVTRDRYQMGRLFGSMRAASLGQLKRAAYVLLAPCLPILLLGRIALNVTHKGRYRAAFAGMIPATGWLCLLWCLGEAVGYLTGRPSASQMPAR